ncbi:MAG TPA: SHOCT domain-containing protein [Candidatus Nanoarchaeia archaeon]|nr:SHOCT domain-containing protein [Candidatus Nanoarchaeia archaeon]
MKALLIMIVLILGQVNAVSVEELNDAKASIDSRIACDKLTDEQLEKIGEYYMEQMMPGRAHEIADEMMGLVEGSAAEEQFHINLARRSYCGQNIGMMGWGMMGNYPTYAYYGLGSIFSLILIGAIGLIIWLIYRLTRREASIDILKRRYAKGEISKKEFEDMKKEIRG